MCLQGLLKNVMELRQCSFEYAYEWIDEQDRKQVASWRMYNILQELCTPQILVDKTPHKCAHAYLLMYGALLLVRHRCARLSR